MYYIKSLPPKNNAIGYYNYSRFGVVISSNEIQVETLKELFSNSPLTEEKLLNALRDDTRIIIENDNDREARKNREKTEKESSIVYKLEEKTIKDDKKRKIQKKIDEFNTKKSNALATETKEDDAIVAKEEIELEKEIKEVSNG